jgi:putative spermidine/putrescine transport system permease protein
MAARSVTDPQPGIANFQAIANSAVDIGALALTLRTAVVVTVVCLLLGYPLAYLIVVAPPRVGGALLSLMLVSLWLSLVARTFAWEVILRDTGIINNLLLGWGIVQTPVGLIRTPLAVTVGMTQVLLPTMVLPMYVVMSRIDRELGLAAAGLGATPWASFVRVFLPLSLPGVLAGSLLVFVLSLGYYITPLLLGGGSSLMIGQLVVDSVEHGEWGYASAIAVVILAMVIGGLLFASRFIRLGSLLGASFRIGADE